MPGFPVLHYLPEFAQKTCWVLKPVWRNFPDGPVVSALCFHCRGLGFRPEIPHAAWHGKKKKKKNLFGIRPLAHESSDLAESSPITSQVVGIYFFLMGREKEIRFQRPEYFRDAK